ncbi:hypothetical protein R3P38DRAFT_3610968 [Favolaschia claudopus]|uniref:F-box domain-containing protein n=1 Tax=Favolaschia claudopus TaxID=2862362 RepID=A0AAW0A647_9AGAR
MDQDTYIVPPLDPRDDLFTHNHPPQGAQIPPIMQYLERASRRLQSIDSQIAALNEERRYILKGIRSHRGVVSVVRNIPTEIWSRIFLMTRPRLAIMELPKAPWALALVSKRWRATAIGLPALWVAFGFETTGHYNFEEYFIEPDDSPQALGRTMEQLRRAGNMPLEVTIDGSLNKITKSLDALCDVCERWDTLSCPWSGKPKLVFLKKIEHRLHLLRRVVVAPQLEDGRCLTLEFNTPSNGDAILSVAFNFAADNSTFSPSAIPGHRVDWSALTHCATRLRVDDFSTFMQGASSLVDCRIRLAIEPDWQSANPYQIPSCSGMFHLPHLERLRINLPSYLQSMRAPRLRELALDCYREREQTTYIVDFLARSSCTLLRLSLFELEPALDLFSGLRALTELTVVRASEYYTHSVIEHLLGDTNSVLSTPVLPNLAALSVDHLRSWSLASATRLISARSDNNAETQPIVFLGMFLDTHDRDKYQTKFPRTEAVNSLRKLQANGLQLGLIKTKAKYRLMCATDPFSTRRCCTENPGTLSTVDR